MSDRPPFAIDVLTLFPEFFGSPLVTGLVGKALRERRAEVRCIDPRRFTHDRHRTVDDTPYGGGAGMVLAPKPWCAALDLARSRGPGPVVLMSPQGRPARQRDLERWSAGQHLVFVCGRYEGFDERIREQVDDEVSVGDFVLTGGEYAALTLLDGTLRLLPGTLGNAASVPEDSFSSGLLEHPQYTRPPEFKGRPVPPVLLEGDHARIAAWRREQQLARTRSRRPDLLEGLGLDLADRRRLVSLERPPRGQLAVGFGVDEDAPALAAELMKLAVAFQLEGLHLVGPGAPAVAAAVAPVSGWSLPGPRRRDRAQRIQGSVPIHGWDDWDELVPAGPVVRVQPEAVTPTVAPDRIPDAFLLVLGEGSDRIAPETALHLPAFRQGAVLNALGPLSTAAIALDRVIGEA